MSSETIDDYFEALERLKNNVPIRIPKGSKINNDNVSLEAGRKKGTIKKSRPVFDELIEEIKKANEKDIKPILEAQDKADKYKEKFIHYKKLHEECLNRELMYLERIDKLEQLLKTNRPINSEHFN
ncbi:hypothetical protein LPB137_05160 [Poseidonibacter parvus]|uniref:Uncharacterized protein n=1 Tax=Poseidonibacter parvus TaxID=1850254 RepID=A0A1P8KL42_9BACT|nr:hypothetical protein [Poseidonibacter parvus]APW65278.1 hypothetical protein LPB137_05160 [Poseidonibacter parvus]